MAKRNVNRELKRARKNSTYGIGITKKASRTKFGKLYSKGTDLFKSKLSHIINSCENFGVEDIEISVSEDGGDILFSTFHPHGSKESGTLVLFFDSSQTSLTCTSKEFEEMRNEETFSSIQFNLRLDYETRNFFEL